MQNIIQKLKSKKVLLSFAVISIACLIYIVVMSGRPAKIENKPTIVYPPDGSQPLLMFPSTAVSFYFETPVTLNMFRIKIEPQIEIKTRLSPDGLAIHVSPTSAWSTEIPHTVYLLDSTGNQISKTSFTYLDPFKHPELVDEHPVGGI